MGTVHEETERKYDGVPGRPLVAAGLPDVIDVAAGKAENLDAVYYDTADLRLLRSGLTLRRRTGGHDPGWHLKIPRGDGHRSEYGLPLEAGEEESPPREFVVRTRGIARGMGLHPVARLHTRRERVVLMDPDGRQLAELARDEVCGQVIDAARTGRRRPGGAPGPSGSVTDVTEVIAWTETEVELIKGPRELLDAVDEALRDQGLQPAVTSSKLERVLSDRLPPRPRQTEAAAGSVGEALTAYLRAQTAQIRELDPAVRLDEPDAVHRMRVAVRRLRSALTAHRRLLAASTVDHLSEELRWLGHVLGEARDAEVLGLHLSDQAATLPPRRIPARWSRASAHGSVTATPRPTARPSEAWTVVATTPSWTPSANSPRRRRCVAGPATAGQRSAAHCGGRSGEPGGGSTAPWTWRRGPGATARSTAPARPPSEPGTRRRAWRPRPGPEPAATASG